MLAAMVDAFLQPEDEPSLFAGTGGTKHPNINPIGLSAAQARMGGCLKLLQAKHCDLVSSGPFHIEIAVLFLV